MLQRLPSLITLAATAALLGLLWLMLGFGWTSDDIGNASTFLGLKDAAAGLLSPELWRSPHYNRFPLNTAYLYGTHTTLLAQVWPAHALKWLLLVAMSGLLLFVIRREVPRSPTAPVLPLLATAFVLTSAPLLLSIADLSCTHYVLTFVFTLTAILLFPFAWGFFPSAVAIGFAGLSSEVGVVMAVQALLLHAAYRRAPLFSLRNAGWLALAWAPWIALKLTLWMRFGPKALAWVEHPLRPADVGRNLDAAFRTLFVPDFALPDFVVAIALVGLAISALASRWRRPQPEVPNGRPADAPGGAELERPTPEAGSRPRRNALLFAAALVLALLPFVLIAREVQSPRLYSEVVLILALWSPWLAARARRHRGLFVIAVGVLVVNQLVAFQHGVRGYRESARSLVAFKHAFADSALSRARFEKTYVLRYRTPAFWPLGAYWGVPLLVQSNLLRTRLLGWTPLRADQQVLVAFGDKHIICLSEGLSAAAVELGVFPDTERASSETGVCDGRCDGVDCTRPVERGG